MKKFFRTLLLMVMTLSMVTFFTGCGNSITDEQATEAKTVGDKCKATFDEVKKGLEELSVYYKQGMDNFDSKFDEVNKGYDAALEIYERRTGEYNKKAEDNTKEEAEAFITTLKSVQNSLDSQKKILDSLKSIITEAENEAASTEGN